MPRTSRVDGDSRDFRVDYNFQSGSSFQKSGTSLQNVVLYRVTHAAMYSDGIRSRPYPRTCKDDPIVPLSVISLVRTSIFERRRLWFLDLGVRHA